ncbi:hypothetical protein GCM10027416_11180 [Okibacterium endophyticum]
MTTASAEKSAPSQNLYEADDEERDSNTCSGMNSSYFEVLRESGSVIIGLEPRSSSTRRRRVARIVKA